MRENSSCVFSQLSLLLFNANTSTYQPTMALNLHVSLFPIKVVCVFAGEGGERHPRGSLEDTGGTSRGERSFSH